ncbi:MAG: hypothetical protein RI909_1834, partial [Bacteroidota bacterium]
SGRKTFGNRFHDVVIAIGVQQAVVFIVAHHTDSRNLLALCNANTSIKNDKENQELVFHKREARNNFITQPDLKSTNNRKIQLFSELFHLLSDGLILHTSRQLQRLIRVID